MDLDAQRKGKCAVIKTSTRQVCKLGLRVAPRDNIPVIVNPRRACAARVTVLGLCVCVCVCLCVCVCVCYSTSHFKRAYSCHKR